MGVQSFVWIGYDSSVGQKVRDRVSFGFHDLHGVRGVRARQLLSIIVEYHEILNSRFALEHRYYTIAHLFQGENNMDGKKVGPSGIKAEQMTDSVWDFIFQDKEFPSKCGIEKSKLEEMKREFEFWYPMDLRVSGKDLIRNHLTMCLYVVENITITPI